jgi:hypothetical protein
MQHAKRELSRATATDFRRPVKGRRREPNALRPLPLNPQTNPMKNTEKLKQLLAEHERLENEKQRHEKMGADLLNEENHLMRTVNIENKAEFEKVNQVRLKREMVPNKVEAFGEAAAETLAELVAECGRLLVSHRAAVKAKTDALKDKVAKALEPYYAPETDSPNLPTLILHERETGLISAKRAAERIAGQSVAGKILFDQSDTLQNGNFLGLPPAVRAKRLLGMIEDLAAMKI